MLPISRKVLVALGAGDAIMGSQNATIFDQILANQEKPKPTLPASESNLGKYALYAGAFGIAAFMFFGMHRGR